MLTRRKALTKIRAEVNDVQTTVIKDQQTQELVFWKDKLSARPVGM